MMTTINQPDHTQPAPTAGPKTHAGPRACTIAFLHVCLTPTAVPPACQGLWTGSHPTPVSVSVVLSGESSAVAVEHADAPGQEF